MRATRGRVADAVATAARSSAAEGLLRVLERVAPRRRGRFAVLTYHRIARPGDEPDLHPGLIGADPAGFADQMRLLAATRPVVSLAELLQARRGGTLPAGAVLVTFDDGYRDLATNAWPVLRSLGLPATVFVPTGYPSRPLAFWWDRLAAAFLDSDRTAPLDTPIGPLVLDDTNARVSGLSRLQAWLKTRPHTEVLEVVTAVAEAAGLGPPRSAVLDWDELRALAADGLTIASHTVGHPLLTRIPIEAVAHEVADAQTDLVHQLGAAPAALAYPSGATSAAVAREAARGGVELAFTTRRGSNDLAALDWLRLRRINVGRRASVPLLRAQLLAGLGGPCRRPGLANRPQP